MSEINWRIYIATEKGLSPYGDATTKRESVTMRQKAAGDLKAQGLSGKVIAYGSSGQVKIGVHLT
jgi:hypothetical protein